MAGKWNNIGLDVGSLQAKLEDITDVLDSVVSILNAIQSAVRAIELFIVTFESVLKALISAIIQLIESLLLEVLENSVHLGVFSNLKLDSEWAWKQKADADPHPNAEDGDAPLNGNGMSGWLGSMLLSTFDEADPFRPITDSGTTVTGLIFVVGGPTFNELKDLLPLLSRLFNFDDFSDAILTQSDLDDLGLSSRWQLLGNYYNTRAAKLSQGFAEAEAAMEGLIDSVADSSADIVPDSAAALLLNSPGPTWVGTPLAACFGEPIRQLASALRRFVNSFSFADTPLTQILNAIAAKIQQIEEAIAFLQDVIASLSALLELLEGGQWYFAQETSGGTSAFFQNAAVAENVPNYGPHGAVVGFSALSTSTNERSIESIFELFGVNVSSSFTSTAVAAATVASAAESVEASVEAAFDFSGIEWQE